MQALRADVDALEAIIPADLWPVPTYAELLFKLYDSTATDGEGAARLPPRFRSRPIMPMPASGPRIGGRSVVVSSPDCPSNQTINQGGTP